MTLKQKWQKKTSQLAQVNWYLCSGVAFLLIVIFGLLLAGWKLNLLLNDADALPIDAVAIKGDRQYTSDSDIRAALQDLMKRSFFSADVTQVQQALENLPWVYRASVRRDWPAKLKVYLQEQVPVAHWNQDAWLNEHGEVFQAPSRPGLEALPWLSGPEKRGAEVLKAFQQLDELLRINSFRLEKLSLTPRLAWEAVLGNGIVLELGREDRMSRVQRFINVYPELLKQDKTVARVDLRYDTGLAVGWQESQQESR
ncbi:cell division protein FtsQ/DivIB [Shewanella yunxiaonensis]|uniref:Cell division protein FtsQ n=1 Tax=Shewanella yunxiaonensis TaxID=2829809 RepID=A0ABX7YV14_9GAMM|nr:MULTISPECIES: cell division protein FtsQ/DivIB [Shewanella]MDF0535547.1 cell division protein FtsQ/DivIB [Shewanella sp. A32]QUN06139.1 cell division protein FtsQ/DivIB [Shewanella yunxiaonensis]